MAGPKISKEEYEKALEIVQTYRQLTTIEKLQQKKKELEKLVGRSFKFTDRRNDMSTTYFFVEKVIDAESMMIRSFTIAKNGRGLLDGFNYSRTVGVNSSNYDFKKEITLEEYKIAFVDYMQGLAGEVTGLSNGVKK